jgi:hypothetical protein
VKSRDKKCQKCREAISVNRFGVEANEHLAGCADCRAYADQLRAMTDGLRQLSTLPIQPTANFHRRWTTAVETAGETGWVARSVELFAQWGRQMAQRNRWALPTLAPLWALILLFKITAPEVASLPPTTVARSPIEVFRALRSETNMQIALDYLLQQAPPNDPAVSPRGNRATAQPMT